MGNLYNVLCAVDIVKKVIMSRMLRVCEIQFLYNVSLFLQIGFVLPIQIAFRVRYNITSCCLKQIGSDNASCLAGTRGSDHKNIVIQLCLVTI